MMSGCLPLIMYDCDVGSANNEGRRYPLVGEWAKADADRYIGAFRLYLWLAPTFSPEARCGACLNHV